MIMVLCLDVSYPQSAKLHYPCIPRARLTFLMRHLRRRCRSCRTGGLRGRLTGRVLSTRRTPSSLHAPTLALAWRSPSSRCVRLQE